MIGRPALIIALILIALVVPASAHEVRPAYLELRETEPARFEVFWKQPLLGTRTSALEPVLPMHCQEISPAILVSEPAAEASRWRVQCPGGLEGGTIRIAGLERTNADTLIRLLNLDGSGQTLRVSQSAPSVVIPMTPSPLDVALSYTRLGFEHILEGLDHLLFVAGLLLLVDGAGRLIKTITAFTLAHSITLALATFGYLSLPPKPVEAVIALSIVFLAVEVIKAQRGERSLMRQAPWLIAFVFGLLHGLGFAGALGDIGLPQGDVPLALVAFNVGVELGQLAFVALFLITVTLARRLAVSPGRRATTVGAYGVGAIASSWFIDRLLGLIA